MPCGRHLEGLRPSVGCFSSDQSGAVDGCAPSGVGALGEDQGAARINVSADAQLAAADRGSHAGRRFDAGTRRGHAARSHTPDGARVRVADFFEAGGAVESGGQGLGSAGAEGYQDRIDIVGGQGRHGRVIGVDDERVGRLGKRRGRGVSQDSFRSARASTSEGEGARCRRSISQGGARAAPQGRVHRAVRRIAVEDEDAAHARRSLGLRGDSGDDRRGHRGNGRALREREGRSVRCVATCGEGRDGHASSCSEQNERAEGAERTYGEGTRAVPCGTRGLGLVFVA